MKEQTLVNMKHDMGKIVEGLHNAIQELNYMNTLTQGILETIKRMPGYETAIAELLESQKKALEEQEESKLEL